MEEHTVTAFCTYCSADKDPAPGELPAGQRYRSPRIETVHNAATSLGLRFLILSGKYGVLEPDDPIPYYDHLLRPEEIARHAALVADRLQALGVADLIFFHRPLAVDDNIGSYIDCVCMATRQAGIGFKSISILAP